MIAMLVDHGLMILLVREHQKRSKKENNKRSHH